ncbi:MAG: DsbA family protein [Nitrospira sp.]|nr:DsbA family protein [Nitrospira sp.]
MNKCRLYSDFNCPFCYAMHERLHALGVMDRIAWQGVQHAPHLPIPMAGWAGHLGAELNQEVQMVRRLAPGLPIVVPLGKPNTGRAIAASARALRADPLRGGAFVRSLYRAFWLDGQDLSDDAVLQREAERQGLASSQIVGAQADTVDAILRAWNTQWAEADHQGVPLLQRTDGTLLVGLMPVDVIERFLS